MFNVIGLSDFTNATNNGLHCWLCQKTVSARALFCHHCGTIQPVRDIDHFARLGIEQRIDVDMEHLEKQYAALSRTLDPQRFLIRGLGERGHAARQMEALRQAYDVLRDPLSRGRYWIGLHEKGGQGQQIARVLPPFIAALRQELDSAAEPCVCDRVAQKAGQAMEQGIVGLMRALRGEDWQLAKAALSEIDGLEAILGDVRARRASLMPNARA